MFFSSSKKIYGKRNKTTKVAEGKSKRVNWKKVYDAIDNRKEDNDYIHILGEEYDEGNYYVGRRGKRAANYGSSEEEWLMENKPSTTKPSARKNDAPKVKTNVTKIPTTHKPPIKIIRLADSSSSASSSDNFKKERTLNIAAYTKRENKLEHLHMDKLAESNISGETSFNTSHSSSIATVFSGSSPVGTAFHVNMAGVSSFKCVDSKGEVIKHEISSKNKYVVTAAHVLPDNLDEVKIVFEGVVIYFNSGKRNVYFSNNHDLALIEVPASVLSTVPMLKLGSFDSKKAIVTCSYFDDQGRLGKNFRVSHGQALYSNDGGYLKHNASTYSGWSGSPIIQNNTVVAIHSGAFKECNVAVSLGFFVDASVAPKNSV